MQSMVEAAIITYNQQKNFLDFSNIILCTDHHILSATWSLHMIFKADKALVDRIDNVIWEGFSIRSELESFVCDDKDVLIDMLESVFDEEFEIFAGEVIQYAENTEVDLSENVNEFINYVLSKKYMTKEQALTLILDTVEVFLINAKRMTS
ncbi:hypothetical protein BGP75_22570 [Motiliproteus sp. MSK22-1]|nr:hypothetical protein BGP75_22570 [Motiliproteus sp. MSK22-1]